MKKLFIIIILLSLLPNLWAISKKDFTNSVELGLGYSSSDVYIYGTSLNLKGISIIGTYEGNLKEHKNTSLITEYIYSFPTLSSSDFPLNDDMLDQDINNIFNNRSMLEIFFGIRNYLINKEDMEIYWDYGFHSNMINLECNELLWLLINTGSYADIGLKTNISKKYQLNIGYKASLDFLTLPITDLYYTEALYQRIDERAPFWATNSIIYISLVFKPKK